MDPLFDKLFKKRVSLPWRRRRDSNSRTSFPVYALSRGASSAILEYFSMLKTGVYEFVTQVSLAQAGGFVKGEFWENLPLSG